MGTITNLRLVGDTRLRFDIAYRGDEYHGWARQNGLDTVQGRIEGALGLIFRQACFLTVAGRTDAGVHAVGQVAHLDVSTDAWLAFAHQKSAQKHGAENILRSRLNKILRGGFIVQTIFLAGSDRYQQTPTDRSLNWSKDAVEFRGTNGIVIKKVSLVPSEFDARFSALWRCYRYQICDRPELINPLEVAIAHVQCELDVEEMAQAAQSFIGEHDFLPFAKPREGASTIREIYDFDVFRNNLGFIEARIRADAFCHSQVRFMMGALIDIGRGLQPTSWIKELLLEGARTGTVRLAPGSGLTLMEVGYPDPEQYQDQADRAKVVRLFPGMKR